MVMDTWLLLPITALLVMVALLLSWRLEWRRLRRRYSEAPRYRWSDGWREPSGDAADLHREWCELGYTPLGTLLGGDASAEGEAYTALYAHPELPIYAWTVVTRSGAIPQALTFWDGGGTLLTTAAPAREARLAALDTGTPRLVQLRVSGRPVALDGQHVGTVRAWALGKRAALPATREALLRYLEDDHRRVRDALAKGRPLPFLAHVKALLGRPERMLIF